MRIPVATYRIQFNADFTFQSAAEITPYLAGLGISHLYASPVFRAVAGSRHGYDGVDFNELNPELGGQPGFDVLAGQLKTYKMGWIQDIVPNHMAYGFENGMLMDILENGSLSPYYSFFDIDWNHFDEKLRGRLSAPFLGDGFDECLKRNEITLNMNTRGLEAVYYDHRFPLTIDSYPDVLDGDELERLSEGDHRQRSAYKLYADILDRIKSLSLQSDPRLRRSQANAIKQDLEHLYAAKKPIRTLIDKKLEKFNAETKDAGTLCELENILSRQVFRLSHWKTACRAINYRRFFDINELITLRQEDPAVFDETHRLLEKLVKIGVVDGVRIDHIDGLADPLEYLERLKNLLGDVYVVVEKILSFDESQPEDWPDQGTTGYEFGAAVNGLFVDRKNEDAFTSAYEDFTRMTDSFEETVYKSKKNFLNTRLEGDLNNLAVCMAQLSDRRTGSPVFTHEKICEALTEILSWFPVYRTYIRNKTPAESDIRYLHAAVEVSVMKTPNLCAELEFIREVLLDDEKLNLPEADEEIQTLHEKAIRRFQQLSAPLTAKGVEDTALYLYNRLISLNEVGGDPARFGISRNTFHEFIEERLNRRPHSMNATSTHDGKRGEDVRARINVLSEIPDEWKAAIEQWRSVNRAAKTRLSSINAPDDNMEYFLYQTLIGAWPLDGEGNGLFVQRLKDYAVKSAREANAYTSWIDPSQPYEDALLSFIDQILDSSKGTAFLASLIPFCRKIGFYGLFNTLSQTLFKIAAPGVPDFYQGSELFDLNLVDPDNRRPVRYDIREDALCNPGEMESPLTMIREHLQAWTNGKIKLFLIMKALAARNRNSVLFKDGDYTPLETHGVYEKHITAFARQWDGIWCVAAVPRLLTGLVQEGDFPLGEHVWKDTYIRLPLKSPGVWRNEFTGKDITGRRQLRAAQLFENFPAALIFGEKPV